MILMPPMVHPNSRDVLDGLNVPPSLPRRLPRTSRVDPRNVKKPRRRLPNSRHSKMPRLRRRVNLRKRT